MATFVSDTFSGSRGTPVAGIGAMAAGETLVVGADVGAWLGAGESITAVGATLTRLDTGASVPSGLQGAPGWAGTVVRQTVTALSPGPGLLYRLRFAVTTTAQTRDADVLISCPN